MPKAKRSAARCRLDHQKPTSDEESAGTLIRLAADASALCSVGLRFPAEQNKDNNRVRFGPLIHRISNGPAPPQKFADLDVPWYRVKIWLHEFCACLIRKKNLGGIVRQHDLRIEDYRVLPDEHIK